MLYKVTSKIVSYKHWKTEIMCNVYRFSHIQFQTRFIICLNAIAYKALPLDICTN